MEHKNIDHIVSLAKRRGFIFPGSEIYGGLSGTWDYGPLGVELKNNIKHLWWKRFVHGRDDMVGIDAAIIMNPKVWEASGHTANFIDPLVECMECHARVRADQVPNIEWKMTPNPEGYGGHQFSYNPDALASYHCESCGKAGKWTKPDFFNLLFRTFVGPKQDSASTAYLRPETAQAMFVNFKNVTDSTRIQIPFGIAQIGKAFRNEITPRDFIFRTREFEQMEIEYFIKEHMWKDSFEHWLGEMRGWIKNLSLEMRVRPAAYAERIHELEVADGERAHYSKRTVDFEYKFPFGLKELYGLAYRTDFDLLNHARASGAELAYTDPVTQEKFVPHVIEPTWGVDRTVLFALLEAYREEDAAKGKRVWLALPPEIAPYKMAIFPLVANKPPLVEKAKAVYAKLKREASIAWDDRGNIGKRYFAQDEIGTPWCVTIDYQTLEDDTITVRDRDTQAQRRIAISELLGFLQEQLSSDYV